MKKIIAMAVMALLPIFAGCGGGGDSAPTAASLKISATQGSLPAGKAVAGLGVTIDLPAGVTVKTDNTGAVDPSVVVPSGLLGGAGKAVMGPVAYTPAVGNTKGRLDLNIASAEAAGVGEGEYVTVNFILNGVAPRAADFVITTFQPVDLTFNDLATMTTPVTSVTLR